LKIGSVTLRNNLIMAPMAGVTDSVYRKILFDFGAGLIVSEMVSAKSIVMGNKNTFRLLENDPSVRPWSVQLFGSDPYVISEAIKIIDNMDFDIVDINMGCPMPKIVNNGEGAGLMTNPALIGKIVYEAVRATSKPITVKIRKGFTHESLNAVECAKIAEENGASMVAVHGRTRNQYYSGEADWDAILEVRNALKIPVAGNGDIFTPEDAVKRLGQTEFVLIARGAMGNPWIFSKTLEYIESGINPNPPSKEDIISTAVKHLEAVEKSGQRIEIMRKHLCWYTKGMHGSAEARKQINTKNTINEMKEVLMGL